MRGHPASPLRRAEPRRRREPSSEAVRDEAAAREQRGRTGGEPSPASTRTAGPPAEPHGPDVAAAASRTACEGCAAHCPAPPDLPRLGSRCATAGPAAVLAALSPGRRARGAAPGPAMWTPTEEEKYGVGR